MSSLSLYSIWRIHGMCQQPLSEWSNLFWSQWWQWLCLSLSCWLWGNQLWKWYLSLLFLYFFKLLPFSNIFIMNPVISIFIIIIFTSVGNRDISSLSKMSFFVFISLSLSLSRYTPTVEIVACASSPCQNGATCFDHNGGSGYVCLCPAGFEGTNCENGTYHFYSCISSSCYLSQTYSSWILSYLSA